MGFLRTFCTLLPAISFILPNVCADDPNLISTGSGDWNWTVSHLGLTDPSRSESSIFSPNGGTVPGRKIMVSLFFPVNLKTDKDADGKCTQFGTATYMPPATAKVMDKMFLPDANAGTFSKPLYHVCKSLDRSLDPARPTVVILEPTVGVSRLLYGGIAQEIASHGFAVFLIDHPYDAAIVEWSNTTNGAATETINQTLKLSPFGNIDPWNATIDSSARSRIADIDFLLKSIDGNKALAQQLIDPAFTVSSGFNITKGVGIAGHGGLGGAVATTLGMLDPRFKQTVNLAGTPPIIESDFTMPYTFMGYNPGFTRDSVPALKESWSHLIGRVASWDLQNADIFDFTDVPKIANDFAKVDMKNVNGHGSINPISAFGIVAQFVMQYMVMGFGPIGDASQLGGLVRHFDGDVLPYGVKKGHGELKKA